MDRALEDGCARVGWDVLYERYIPELRAENTTGERTARSPFPFSDDRQASFSVNVRSGLWQCWHSAPITGMRGGNYVQFVALMNSRTGSDGRPVTDFPTAERNLRIELGLVRPVDLQWLAQCQANLAHSDSSGHTSWIGHKPWHPQILTRLGIGWDNERSRLVLPIYDHDGILVNCRMYRPGATPKILWHAVGLPANYPFPHCALDEPWVILVEGEPDAISLRSVGFNGVSGQGGSGTPVPIGRWWVGKRIFVWMDSDNAGQEAAGTAVGILVDGAEEVRLVAHPRWEGMPDNADPSDFIMYLLRQGLAIEQVQREISRILGEARPIASSTSTYDSNPQPVEFHQALTAENAGRRITFPAHVLGKSSHVYNLITRLNITCPATGHTWCNSCVMHTQYHGNANIELDPRSPLSLKLIQVAEDKRDIALKEHIRIPQRCPEPRFHTIQSVDMEIAMLGTTIAESETTVASHVDRRRHESIILVPNDRVLEENVDYNMEGFVYAAPKSQEQVFLLDRFERRQTNYESFRMTDDIRKLLSTFIPISDVAQQLMSVVADMENTHTNIRGRFDLHLMMRSVWHSVIAFQFGANIHKRGWLEAVIIGDTRCGKSHTFKAMASLFGTGMLVDCKLQTQAGMLGSVETSPITGERYVIAGLLPQQDRAGPLCMDEFSTSQWDRRSIMDAMSSTRAEGMVRISKAAHATFTSRVRLICMANPGMGRLMHELGIYGCEVLPRLIEQPEDIARFDMAMCVSQQDVPFDVINMVVEKKTPIWGINAHRQLLAWTWSRQPNQICWSDGAEESVLSISAYMVSKYSANIPIVEPSDQRMRVAKLAVSIAAQCFSTDKTGELIVVRPEHVYCVQQFFNLWYDKQTFGYDRFSHNARISYNIREPEVLDDILDKLFAPNHTIYASSLARICMFNEKVLQTIIPISFMDIRNVMHKLMYHRCIRVGGKKMEFYEPTPAFIQYLEDYIIRRS